MTVSAAVDAYYGSITYKYLFEKDYAAADAIIFAGFCPRGRWISPNHFPDQAERSIGFPLNLSTRR